MLWSGMLIHIIDSGMLKILIIARVVEFNHEILWFKKMWIYLNMTKNEILNKDNNKLSFYVKNPIPKGMFTYIYF